MDSDNENLTPAGFLKQLPELIARIGNKQSSSLKEFLKQGNVATEAHSEVIARFNDIMVNKRKAKAITALLEAQEETWKRIIFFRAFARLPFEDLTTAGGPKNKNLLGLAIVCRTDKTPGKLIAAIHKLGVDFIQSYLPDEFVKGEQSFILYIENK